MPTAPYDTVTTVMNAAKVRLNDRIETLAAIGGGIIDNSQFFTLQAINSAWRKLQEFLAELGYTGLKQEVVFSAVAVAGTTDAAISCYIDWAGYYDGNATQVAPVLPQTMIRPYDLWERPNSTAPTGLMTEMEPVLNGLPAVPKTTWNRQWEWRNDKLYFPGSIVVTDLRLRYAQYLADFVDNSPAASTQWFAQVVPIMRSLDAFADYICREISIARDDPEGAAMFHASGQANARLILNRDTAQPKSVFKASELGKMRDRYTPSTGNDNPQTIQRGNK